MSLDRDEFYAVKRVSIETSYPFTRTNEYPDQKYEKVSLLSTIR